METLRDAILSVLKRFFVAIVSTLGILTLFGFVLEKMEAIVNTRLHASLGKGAVLFTAIIGTPLHETAHWLGCKIFGFKVHEVELLRPIKYRADGILGFVQYSYNQDSLWQKLGCFFVGIAPMIMGGIFILLFTWLLKPEIYIQIREKVDKVSYGVKKPSFISVCWAGFSGFWKGLFSLKKWGWLRGIICLYVVMSISMHMTISPADIEGAKAGIWVVLALYGIFAIVTAMIGKDCIIPGAKTAAVLSAFFSIGLFADALLLVISLLFAGFGDFKGFNKIIDSSFINTVNLNKYVEVTVEGYDHYGTLSVKFDNDKFLKRYGKKINKKINGDIEDFIDYFSSGNKKADVLKGMLAQLDMASIYVYSFGTPSPDRHTELSNGDVITLSWEKVYGNGFFDMDNFIKERTGLKVSHKDFTYEVKGLKTVENFDPFDMITYSLEGISGAITFGLDASLVESDMDITFSPKSVNTLKNGDILTVCARIENVDEYVAAHNSLPYPLKRVYEVTGLPYYAVSSSDIGQTVMEKKNKEAEEVALGLSGNWVEECRIDSATCVGNIFLSYEDPRYRMVHNKYVSVIKVHVNSDLKPKLEFDYYYPVEYLDFLVTAGKCDEGIDYASWNTKSFDKVGDFVGKGDNRYSKLTFKGFERIEDVVAEYTRTNEGFTIMENNIER